MALEMVVRRSGLDVQDHQLGHRSAPGLLETNFPHAICEVALSHQVYTDTERSYGMAISWRGAALSWTHGTASSVEPGEATANVVALRQIGGGVPLINRPGKRCTAKGGVWLQVKRLYSLPAPDLSRLPYR